MDNGRLAPAPFCLLENPSQKMFQALTSIEY